MYPGGNALGTVALRGSAHGSHSGLAGGTVLCPTPDSDSIGLGRAQELHSYQAPGRGWSGGGIQVDLN